MRNEETHEFEGKIRWSNDKTKLIEATVPLYDNHYMYWLPVKCTIDHNESDGEGNFMFKVTDWWYRKVQLGDFQADDNR